MNSGNQFDISNIRFLFNVSYRHFPNMREKIFEKNGTLEIFLPIRAAQNSPIPKVN